MNDYRGRIVSIGQTETRGERFTVRSLVLTDDAPKYPNFVKFEAQADLVVVLDNFRVGQEVLVTYQLRGREWTSRDGRRDVFNTLKLTAILGTGDPGPVTQDRERYFNENWT